MKEIGELWGQILSVAVVLSALAYMARQLTQAIFRRRELRLKAELDKQIKLADRYSKGVGHIGSSDASVRIGGIYEVGQLLDIGPTDEFYWPVLDLLTSFIRLRVTSRAVKKGPSAGGVMDRIEDDVQAALNVIGRRVKLKNRPHDSPIDLSGLDLSDSWLAGAHLEWSYLSWACLDHADISHAHVSEALLDDCTFPENP